MAAVLVIQSDPELRRNLVAACRARRIPAIGVSRIAEIERWPTGQIVITDVAHLTSWWKHVGATQVIAVLDHSEESAAALANGATACLERGERPVSAVVAELIQRL